MAGRVRPHPHPDHDLQGCRDRSAGRGAARPRRLLCLGGQTRQHGGAASDRRADGQRRHRDRHQRPRRRRARRDQRAIAARRRLACCHQDSESAAGRAAKRAACRRTRTDEHLGSLHPPADRHVAVDGGAGAGRHRGLSAVAGGAAAAGRFPDHPGQRHGARRQPRNHGRHRRHAARAPVRPDRRRRADELGELARLDRDHVAIRSQPQHRRRRAGRAGRDHRGRIEPAEKSLARRRPIARSIRRIRRS